MDCAFWNEIVDGRRKGIAALCISPILLALSLFYRLAVWARNKAYDLGALRIRRLPHPVISVGNIVAGGAGKTPCVRLLVAELQKRGIRAAILSRGYGAVQRQHRYPLLVSDGARILRSAAEAGDEPVMLAKSLAASIVVADPNRIRGGMMAARKFAVDCFILDDGFQHRKLHRDLTSYSLIATGPSATVGSSRLAACANRGETCHAPVSWSLRAANPRRRKSLWIRSRRRTRGLRSSARGTDRIG